MIPPEIIKLALAGGWHKGSEYEDAWYQYQARSFPEKILLDREFWIALCGEYSCKIDDMENHFGQPGYLFHTRRLYDLILTNQPTDKFWASLVDNKG